MATVHRPTEVEASAVEVYRLELTEAEQSALRAAPEMFLRDLLERDGHTVNRLLIDTRVLNDDCPGGEYEVVHLLSPADRRSEHSVRCVEPR
ncbi:hypothetical protein ACFU9X_07775 [Streptomyces atratus]|uniref:hypothetical protein n=1 Tax=Streptomyces atratus TaxID=1893 RepID=UPI0036A7C1FC